MYVWQTETGYYVWWLGGWFGWSSSYSYGLSQSNLKVNIFMFKNQQL